MKRFKKGDIICGNNSSNTYSITSKNNEFVGEVIKYLDQEIIQVKLISCNNNPRGSKIFGVRERCFELLPEIKDIKKRKHIPIDIIVEGDTIKSIYDNNIGTAKKNPIDSFDINFGIILSTMRALGMSKRLIEDFIDVYFKDKRFLENCTSEELINELSRRIKE